MKTRWYVLLPLTLAVLALIALRVWWLGPDPAARAAAKRTRAELKAQGFRLGLEEFDLVPSPAESAAAARLVSAVTALDRSPQIRLLSWAMMQPAGKSAARVGWRQTKLATFDTNDVWPQVFVALDAQQETLRSLADVALNARLRFEVLQRPGVLQFQDIDRMRTASQILSASAVAELRRGDPTAAWTFLMAATQLATRWAPEPSEASLGVRLAVASTVFAATWEVLHTNAWSEAQLASLESCWSKLDLWRDLPASAALARAESLSLCELSRGEAALSLWGATSDFIQVCLEQWRNPMGIVQWWGDKFGSWRARVIYKRRTSYEEEVALAKFYTKREVELRDALTRTTWQELRKLPVAGPPSPVQLASRARPTAEQAAPLTLGDALQPESLVARVAATEALRRLILTGLALERHRLRRGAYPDRLEVLDADLIAMEPTDFMDGQRMRYHREGADYVLYSVGLDAEDQGGDNQRVAGSGSDLARRPDLVWARAATVDESAALDASLAKPPQGFRLYLDVPMLDVPRVPVTRQPGGRLRTPPPP